eukprot:6472452-Amphidinium_carterae.1
MEQEQASHCLLHGPKSCSVQTAKLVLLHPTISLASDMPSNMITKCEVTEAKTAELIKDHWTTLSQLNFNLPTSTKLELAGPWLIAMSKLTSRLNRKPLVAGVQEAARCLRQQTRGLELMLMQLWQHLLGKKRNKEAAHNFNLHVVEAACLDHWALLPQAKQELKQELSLDQTASEQKPPCPVKVEELSLDQTATEQTLPCPVKVEFTPPPKLIGVCSISHKALVYMPSSGLTHQQPLQHGANGLAEAICPDGQTLTTLFPNSKLLPPNPPLSPYPLPDPVPVNMQHLPPPPPPPPQPTTKWERKFQVKTEVIDLELFPSPPPSHSTPPAASHSTSPAHSIPPISPYPMSKSYHLGSPDVMVTDIEVPAAIHLTHQMSLRYLWLVMLHQHSFGCPQKGFWASSHVMLSSGGGCSPGRIWKSAAPDVSPPQTLIASCPSRWFCSPHQTHQGFVQPVERQEGLASDGS